MLLSILLASTCDRGESVSSRDKTSSGNVPKGPEKSVCFPQNSQPVLPITLGFKRGNYLFLREKCEFLESNLCKILQKSMGAEVENQVKTDNC